MSGVRAIVLIIAVLFVLMLGAHFAVSQEHFHPPEHAQLHETFYQTWLRPEMRKPNGERQRSCCNLMDCYPTKFERSGGTWFFWGREAQAWRAVPDRLIEQNQSDPRESPDGQGHVCASIYHVYCAVLGAGI